MTSALNHLYILATVLLTVYGQLVIKWQLDLAGDLPSDPAQRVKYLFRVLLSPWVISGLFGAFLAAVSWMVALKKFDLSYAYPFVSLTFPTVLACTAVLFHEQLSWSKSIGMALIMMGIVVHARM